jgi:hypothetical protein
MCTSWPLAAEGTPPSSPYFTSASSSPSPSPSSSPPPPPPPPPHSPPPPPPPPHPLRLLPHLTPLPPLPLAKAAMMLSEPSPCL